MCNRATVTHLSQSKLKRHPTSSSLNFSFLHSTHTSQPSTLDNRFHIHTKSYFDSDTNPSFEYVPSLSLSHTSTLLPVSTPTAFTTSPFQADQKHVAVEIEKEWETVWEVFPELFTNLGEPATNQTFSPSTTQAIISSTTQVCTTTNSCYTLNPTTQATYTTPTSPSPTTPKSPKNLKNQRILHKSQFQKDTHPQTCFLPLTSG